MLFRSLLLAARQESQKSQAGGEEEEVAEAAVTDRPLRAALEEHQAGKGDLDGVLAFEEVEPEGEGQGQEAGQEEPGAQESHHPMVAAAGGQREGSGQCPVASGQQGEGSDRWPLDTGHWPLGWEFVW